MGMEDKLEGIELTERREMFTGLLERTLGWLNDWQQLTGGKVEKISGTAEMSDREEELAGKLAEAKRDLEELKAAASPEVLAKALLPLRRTLPSATAEMLAKQGIGEGAVDLRTLDAALVGLSLEQRIAVKSQLRRAGAIG